MRITGLYRGVLLALNVLLFMQVVPSVVANIVTLAVDHDVPSGAPTAPGACGSSS